ncbi:MAG: DUF4214 domain-containing protein [Clostridia bacterium]|nr:DUF4214 domain-containing protein [Clostridia bacterium]
MKKKLLTICLSVIMLINTFGTVGYADEVKSANLLFCEEGSTQDPELLSSVVFIRRLYEIALDRTPTDTEIAAWEQKFNDQEVCGVSAAFGFVYSPEFQNSNFPDDIYVDKMYNMLLGREADSEGKAYWVSNLQNGMDREDIFAGFANSQEFFDLCMSYGIISGYYIKGIGMDRNSKINGFVTRLYENCLNRRGDIGGQGMWVSGLAEGKITGIDAAYGFLFSEEFTTSNADIYDYVDTLYVVLLDRVGSAGEVSSWVQTAIDTSRTCVFDGFSFSQEFSNICNEYGIVRGDTLYGGEYTAPLNRTHGTLEGYEELYALEDEIGQRHGVTIHIADEVPEEYLNEYNFLRLFDYETIKQALICLDEELYMFPREIYYYLTRGTWTQFDIYITGIGEVGGYTDGYGYICIDGYYLINQPEIFAHEMSHCLDMMIINYFDEYMTDESWYELNPDEFTYYEEYEGYEDFTYDPTYFINSYSTTFATEDRAVLMQYAMYCYLNETNISFEEPVIAKMRYYFTAIRGAFGTDEWPEVLPWEQVLYDYQGT